MSLQFKGPLVCCAKSLQSHLTVRARQAPLSMGIFQAKILEWIAMPATPRDLPNPGIEFLH